MSISTGVKIQVELPQRIAHCSQVCPTVILHGLFKSLLEPFFQLNRVRRFAVGSVSRLFHRFGGGLLWCFWGFGWGQILGVDKDITGIDKGPEGFTAANTDHNE